MVNSLCICHSDSLFSMWLAESTRTVWSVWVTSAKTRQTQNVLRKIPTEISEKEIASARWAGSSWETRVQQTANPMKEIQNKSASVILWRGLAGRGVLLQKENRPHMLQTVFVLRLWTLAILPEMMQSWWTRSAARETIVNSLCRQQLSQGAISDQLSSQTTRKPNLFFIQFLTKHISKYIFRYIWTSHFLKMSLCF